MKVINQKKEDLLVRLNALISSRIEAESNEIDSVVRNILNEVKLKGDDALIEFSKKFDNTFLSKSQILIPDQIRSSYKDLVDQNVLKYFEIAKENIIAFHKKQLPQNYEINKDDLIIGS